MATLANLGEVHVARKIQSPQTGKTYKIRLPYSHEN